MDPYLLIAMPAGLAAVALVIYAFMPDDKKQSGNTEDTGRIGRIAGGSGGA